MGRGRRGEGPPKREEEEEEGAGLRETGQAVRGRGVAPEEADSNYTWRVVYAPIFHGIHT